MEVSQQGSLTAFTATRLQRPQRNLAGISPGSRVLDRLARARVRSGMETIHGEVVLVVVEFCCHGGANGWRVFDAVVGSCRLARKVCAFEPCLTSRTVAWVFE
jgi:hypothetical protein